MESAVMGNNIGSAVNKGITRDQFQASLSRNGVKGDKFDKAMGIFDHYAAMNTSAEGEDAGKILDEQEQVMARSEFAQFNKDDDNNVGKREFNKNGGKNSNFGDYNAAKAYMEAMEHAAQSSGNGVQVGEMTVTEDGAVVTYGANTPNDVSDDVVNVYTRGADGKYSGPSELEAELVSEEPVVPEESVPEPPKPPTFKDEAEVKSAVVKYLLGGQDIGNIDSEFMDLTGLECTVNNETGEATVKYDGKTYQVRVKEGTEENPQYVFENDDDGGSTLHSAVLSSTSNDAEHHYYNRGRKGNLKSQYNAADGTIENKSGAGRQGVSQVQTFSSMLMNGNESTTLKLDGQIQEDGTRKALTGESIIASIDTGADNADGEITMAELVKFLRGAVKEANKTTDEAKPGTPSGSRIYAPGVDFDLKDIANLGVVFNAMDRDGNGKLNAGELDELIAKLTSGNGDTMSSMAGKTGLYTYQGKPEAPEQPQPEKPQQDVHKREFGDVAKVDRTRENTAGGSVTYTYSGGANGTRSMVADDGTGTTRIVTNENVVEYDDHGLFDWGKKEFLVVQGLEANVRAEVVDGNADGPMTMKVKDSSGNVTYRQIVYDAETKTYSQGEQVYKNKNGQYKTAKERTSDGFASLGLTKDLKLPKGFSFDYDKKGELVCKFKGATVSPQVAKVMIMKVNVPEEKTE